MYKGKAYKLSKVELNAIQDADALYNEIVKGAQRQVSILRKVEGELKELEAKAKQLEKMEDKLESMAKELGVDLNNNYASSQWVRDLNKYSNDIGNIASVL